MDETTDRIIEMAWEDRTPFESHRASVWSRWKSWVALMRRQLKRTSFERWRQRYIVAFRSNIKKEVLPSYDLSAQRQKTDQQQYNH